MRRQLLLVIILLTACSTPYQPRGLLGGFSEARLDETTYQVSFKGNGYTSAETVQQYVLYRAAELTTQAGFDHFVIVSGRDISRTFAHTTPGTATTSSTFSGNATMSGTATPSGNSFAISGSGAVSGSGTSVTTYTPPRTTFVIKPGEIVTVRMGNGPKPSDPNAYEAASVLQYLGPSIKR